MESISANSFSSLRLSPHPSTCTETTSDEIRLIRFHSTEAQAEESRVREGEPWQMATWLLIVTWPVMVLIHNELLRRLLCSSHLLLWFWAEGNEPNQISPWLSITNGSDGRQETLLKQAPWEITDSFTLFPFNTCLSLSCPTLSENKSLWASKQIDFSLLKTAFKIWFLKILSHDKINESICIQFQGKSPLYLLYIHLKLISDNQHGVI